jgi:hypothetical protein
MIGKERENPRITVHPEKEKEEEKHTGSGTRKKKDAHIRRCDIGGQDHFVTGSKKMLSSSLLCSSFVILLTIIVRSYCDTYHHHHRGYATLNPILSSKSSPSDLDSALEHVSENSTKLNHRKRGKIQLFQSSCSTFIVISLM